MTDQQTQVGRDRGGDDARSSGADARDEAVLAAIDEAAMASGFSLDQGQRDVAERLAGRLAGRRAGLRAETPALTGADSATSTPSDTTEGAAPLPRGLYLWGPAGRGKTWLLDAYFDALPTTAKRRVHFHSFFRGLHRAIHRHRTAAVGAERAAERAAAVTNAVDAAVDELLDGATLVYFDELHVHDPGDATLITRLLEALFARDVVLIASSNYPPTGLLPDPVYHYIFEPGIALLEANMDVVELPGEIDHRLTEPTVEREGFARGTWISPGTDAQLASVGLHRPTGDERTELPISGHVFAAKAVRGDTVWFSSTDLLEAKTSVGDYLAWAGRFDRWILDDVPASTELTREARMRFVHLVDALCDLGRELHVIAAVPRADFIALPGFARDSFRTESRLALLRELPR